MKTLRLLPLLALLSMLPAGVSAAQATQTYDVQGWWLKSGIKVPTAVGSHIHIRATVPADGAIVNGKLTIPVRVTLHNAKGTTNWFRIGTENTQLYITTLKLGPCADCSADISAVIDVSGVSTGRHELRMSANIPDEDPALSGSQRFFPTFNGQVCIRACTPTYRPAAPVIEGRSWYTNAPYQNASIRTRLSDIKPGATISVRTGPGSGGRPTVFSGVYLNPDMHAGNAGRVLFTRNGPYTGPVTIPANAACPCRLVVLASDGQNAGIVLYPFGGTP